MTPPEPTPHYVISFPAPPGAVVVHITNYSTLLLLVLLYRVFSTATSLPEEVPRPYEEPRHPDRWLWRYALEEKPCGFQVLPRRWMIERTFAWLGQARRLAKDYERLPETALALIYAAMSRLMLRRLARLV